MRQVAAASLGVLVALAVGSTYTFLAYLVAWRALEVAAPRLENVPPVVSISVAIVLQCLTGWVCALLAAATGEQVAGRIRRTPATPENRPGKGRAVLAYVLGVTTGLAVSGLPVPLTCIANDFHFLIWLLLFAGPTAGLLAARAVLRREGAESAVARDQKSGGTLPGLAISLPSPNAPS